MTLELADEDKQLLLWWRPRDTLADDIGDSYAHHGLDLFGRYLAADGRHGHVHLLQFCVRWQSELSRGPAGPHRDDQIAEFLGEGEREAAWPNAAEVLISGETGEIREVELSGAGSRSMLLDGLGHISDETGHALLNLAIFVLETESGFYRAFGEAVSHWRAQLLSDAHWRAHAGAVGTEGSSAPPVEAEWIGNQQNGLPRIPDGDLTDELRLYVERYNAYVDGVYEYCSYYQTPVLDHLDPGACRSALLLVEQHENARLEQVCRQIRKWLAETVEPYQQRLAPAVSPVEVELVFDALQALGTENVTTMTGISYDSLPQTLAGIGLLDIYDGIKQGVASLRKRRSVPEADYGNIGVGVQYASEQRQIKIIVRLRDGIRVQIAANNQAVLDELATRHTKCYYIQAADLVTLSPYQSSFGPDPLSFAVLRIAANWHENPSTAFELPDQGDDIGRIERITRWSPGKGSFLINKPRSGGSDSSAVERLIQARFPKCAVRVSS